MKCNLSQLKIKYYIWFVVAIISGLLFDIYKCFNKNENTETLIAYYWIIVLTIFVVQFIVRTNEISRKNKLIFLFGFALRWTFLFFNTFVFDIWQSFSNSGDDAGLYFQVALDRYYMREVTGEYSELAYVKFLEKAYYIIGANEVISIFINILAFTLMSWLILLFSKRLSSEIDYRIFALLQLMPVTIWLNTTLLRESLISLFIALSLILFYYFYSEEKGFIYLLGAMVAASVSFCLHSGYIVILAIYAFFAILYYGRKLGTKFYCLAFIIIVVGIFLCLQNEVLRAYLGTYLTKERLYKGLGLKEISPETRGNSYYLSDFPVNNGIQLLVYVALKCIYFWFSPMAWDLKGISYAAIMLFDAIPCLILWILCFNVKKYKPFWCILLLETLAYAIGTGAAGTAMRHRNVFVPLLIVIYLIGKNGKKTCNTNYNNE